MRKSKTKKLFWRIVNQVENCSDTVVKNDKGVVVERGMRLSNGFSVMFGLDDGVLTIYDEQYIPLMNFTEKDRAIRGLKEMFETLEL